MSNQCCCVKTCRNTGRNSKYKFFKFPSGRSYKLPQRNLWIQAVRKANSDPLWVPKSSQTICSYHFVGNVKGIDQLSPNYVPTIFSNQKLMSYSSHESKINRHKRFLKRRTQILKKADVNTDVKNVRNKMQETISTTTQDEDVIYMNCITVMKVDEACQVNIFVDDSSSCVNCFVCNRIIYEGGINHAEIQTDLPREGKIILHQSKTRDDTKKFRSASCGKKSIVSVDKSVGPNISHSEDETIQYFNGYASIKNKEQLKDMAGVSRDTFNFLLKIMDKYASTAKHKVSLKNSLLIFLIIMKTGLKFSAISLFFGVHQTTISHIFFSILHYLFSCTANMVFWPDKDIIKKTMPACFHPKYSNTRVIIDCIEFQIEMPADMDDCVQTYSDYINSFTAKVLIGITPSGFICFKSKVAGGKMSDYQITVESGLIDLLEKNDIVLADKSFPDIQKAMDASGVKILIIPPFLEKKSEFSEEETMQTYIIPQVRIHLENIMHRLRFYNILSEIPTSLFNSLDEIVHICCVLVNLQSPTFSQNSEDFPKKTEDE